MKCEICKKEALKNQIICSDHCDKIRLTLMDLGKKYFPTNGCDNCWGDLHQGCSEQCKREFKEAHEFALDLRSFIHLILKKTQTTMKQAKEILRITLGLPDDIEIEGTKVDGIHLEEIISAMEEHTEQYRDACIKEIEKGGYGFSYEERERAIKILNKQYEKSK